jgi:hypothetical protein
MRILFISLLLLGTAALLSAGSESGLRDYLLGREIVKQESFYLAEDLNWSIPGVITTPSQPLRRVFAYAVGGNQVLNIIAILLFFSLAALLRLRSLGATSGLIVLCTLLFFESRTFDRSFGIIFYLLLLIQLIRGAGLAELAGVCFLCAGFSSAVAGGPVALLAFLLTAPRGETFGLLWRRLLAVSMGVGAGLLLFGRDELRSIDTHQFTILLPVLGAVLILAALSRVSVLRPWSALLIFSLLVTLVDSANLPMLIVSISIWVSLQTDRIYYSKPAPHSSPLLWLLGVLFLFSAPESAPVFNVTASRVFNPPQAGAVLQAAGVKTFIDERREIFSLHASSQLGREAFFKFQRVYYLQPGWQESIREFETLVIPEDHPLNEALSHWERVGEAGTICLKTPREEVCERYLELRKAEK